MKGGFYMENDKFEKCPDCGSDRLTLFKTFDLVVGYNVKTGKKIYIDKNAEHGGITIWSYRCRKCGWNSNSFTE